MAVAAKKLRTYEFTSANKVAERGAEEVTRFLYSLNNTIRVDNVEKDPQYQGQDIDLIWYHRSKLTNKIEKKTIEIKADRQYATGNYFFETISNTSKNTPGCFMYTQADVIFYYYIEQKELHMLPTIATRTWFIENEHKFKERKTTTSSNKGLLYETKGRLVPRKTLLHNVATRVVNIAPYI